MSDSAPTRLLTAQTADDSAEPGLPPDQKLAIRLQEQFRFEVRQALTPKLTFWEKVWGALNSPFGIAMFSGVILWALTTSYARYQTSSDESAKRRSTVESLDIEISYRYSMLLLALRDEHQRQQLEARTLAKMTGGAASEDERTRQQQLFSSRNRDILNLLRSDPRGEYGSPKGCVDVEVAKCQ